MLTTDLQDRSNVISIHNKVIEKQQREEIEEMTHDKEFSVFISDVLPAMNSKEIYKVFYGNPTIDELEEIMERVVRRAGIRKEILLEKLN